MMYLLNHNLSLFAFRSNILNGILVVLLSGVAPWTFAQSSQKSQICVDAKFNKKVDQLISYSVPVVAPVEVLDLKNSALLLDTRELKEYEISHIEGALHAGYDRFDIEDYLSLPRDTTVVLYCSVGYRSEKIGELFVQAGFKNVFNMYGSIFEWINQDQSVVDMQNKKTKKVHTYNKAWSKWVNDSKAEKVW